MLLIYFPCLPANYSHPVDPSYFLIFSLSLCVGFLGHLVGSIRTRSHSYAVTAPNDSRPRGSREAFQSISSTHLSTSRYCKSGQANLCKIYPQNSSSIIIIIIIIPATVHLFPLTGLLPLTLSSYHPSPLRYPHQITTITSIPVLTWHPSSLFVGKNNLGAPTANYWSLCRQPSV